MVECPRCERDDFDSERAMKIHHKQTHGESYDTTIEVTCENCGNQKTVRKAVYKEDIISRCQKCLDETVTQICSYCGNTRERPPGRVLNDTSWDGDGDTYYADYCKECKEEALSESMTEENHPRWSGGYEPYYGKTWQKVREKVIERDDGRCSYCGIEREEHREKFGRDLDVHHKEKANAFEDYSEANDMDNLITLCREHHLKIEFGGLEL